MREGFHTVTPYLTTGDVSGLVDFVQRAFGAVETHRAKTGSGGLHAELRVGDSMIMIGGGPGVAPMPAMLLLYVDNVDAFYQCALDAGATPVQKPADTPDGDRRGGVRDAFGNQWFLAKS